ncbi:MAG: P-loop NTPase [Planctomycetota bacterium]
MNTPHGVVTPSPRTEPRGFGAPFVLVTGGKGGVGKSTVAANLGILLAAGGASPLLVDLDFELANLDVLLGMRPERNVESFFGGETPLSECILEGPAALRLLPAGSGNVAMGRPDPQRLRRLADGLRRLLPHPGIILGDTAAGIGPEVTIFAAHADRVLVVTTPEPAAVTDAYGVIKAVDAEAAERGIEVPTPELLVNFAEGVEEARRVADGLRGVCERFLARSPRLVGWLPRSRAVRQGIVRQRPFVLADPRSLAARCLRRLAERYAPAGRGGPVSPLKAKETHVR